MQNFPPQVGIYLPNNMTWHDIPEDSNHNSHHCENLKSHNDLWDGKMVTTTKKTHSQKILSVFKPHIYGMQSNYYALSRTNSVYFIVWQQNTCKFSLLKHTLCFLNLKLSAMWKRLLKKISWDRGFVYVLLFIFKVVTLLIQTTHIICILY
jgi:hypothetical protein